ncbi:MAG: nuclear transport factor 2 family protein [Marmoricola sp.]
MTSSASSEHDLHDIQQLKYRYFRNLDLKRWDDFATCLLPDITADYAGLVFDNRDALVTFMRDHMGPGLISLHQAHHPEIVVDGDEATGTWYLEDKVIVPDAQFVLEGAAFYSDRYRRTPDGWRIAHTGYRRTYEMSWSSADVPSLQIKRGTAYDA